MRRFLKEHAAKTPISFHMPGHKGSGIFRRYGYGDFLDNLIDYDLTEIPGADNLFQAEGILMDVQKKYAELYDVKHSYLLINGTSGGILASVLAAVKPGGKLIMARNCHKSVFNALTLGQIEPVYAQPTLLEEQGITGAVSPEEIERCLAENPDAQAVILPSPNYYGICSDIRAIAEIVHRAGKVLITDQAHGAHLKFFHKFGYGSGMPPAAEDCGSDITICSIHKTLASITQSAVLNLNSDRIDRYLLEDKLQAVESTSPSYLLMGFLDVNADLLMNYGKEAIGSWSENVGWFYKAAEDIEGLAVLQTNADSNAGPDSIRYAEGNSANRREGLDRTKINLDMSSLGISGARLEELLMEDNIFSELHTGNILMLMTGIGNTRSDMEKAIASLKKIAETARKASFAGPSAGSPVQIASAAAGPDIGSPAGQTAQIGPGAWSPVESAAPEIESAASGTVLADAGLRMTISGAALKAEAVSADSKKVRRVPTAGALHEIPAEKEFVLLEKSAGRLCAGSIIPYPPGIPLVCPGEEITAGIVSYIGALRAAGEKVIGVNDRGEVLVGKQD